MDIVTKRKILSDKLAHEVNDLHPLLDVLFRKHEKIDSFDYTHGPNEFGADFILCRTDEVLNASRYIGVIAKVDKIQQDFSDVERQIEECAIPRKYDSGRKEIQLDEIWVLTSKTISNNAESKILSKYSKTKISFIEQDTLVTWIDQFLPSYWSAFPVNLGEYLSGLRSKIQALDERYSLVPAQKSFYLERDIYYTEEEFSKAKKFDLKKIVVENKLVFLESGAGLGKSKLIRRSILELCEFDVHNETKVVPIFCTYYELVHVFNSSLDALFKASISQDAIADCGSDVRFMFFLDGIDEVKYSYEEHEEKIAQICAEVNASANYKLFVASRPINSFTDSTLRLASALTINLAPLSKKNVLLFIKSMCDSVSTSKRLYEDISKSHFIRDIAKTPIAAILLGKLLQSNSSSLPSNITELYNKYFELMLGRWDVDKGVGFNAEYELGGIFLMDIAHYMNENNLQQIAYSEARTRFVEYLDARNLNVMADDIISYLADRAGVIVRDPISNTLSFKHKSFMDYFDARYRIGTTEIVVDKRVFNQYWSAVYFFYIGLKKDCEGFLGRVMSVTPDSPAQKLAKSFLFGDYLLAGFQTPYRVVEEHLPRIIIESAKFYAELNAKKVESPLAELSPMFQLNLQGMLMKYSFAYEYFRKALPKAIEVIESDKSLSDDERGVALFLAGVILLELGDPFGIQYLFDKHDGQLPMEVRLAVLRHESKSIEHLPLVLKKAEKKLEKDLKGSRGLSLFVKGLYKGSNR